MPAISPNSPNIRTRLAPDDHLRFQQLSKMQQLSETEFVRQALLYFMQHLEQGSLNEAESIYAQQIKSSTNRICALLSKVAMDVRAVYFFLGEDEAEKMEHFRNQARKVINKTLTKDELDLALKLAVRVSEAISENPNNNQT
jgi:hypothetical protein